MEVEQDLTNANLIVLCLVAFTVRMLQWALVTVERAELT